MAEVVVRGKKRRTDRWMQTETRRLYRLTAAQIRTGLRYALEMSPGFLLAFADVLSIPSGLHAAYITALSACGKNNKPPLLGGAAALVMRLLWGLAPRWELLITLALLLFAPLIVYGRSTAVLMGFTAASLLPAAIVGCMSTTAIEMVLGIAVLPVSALSAPLMYRAIKALTGKRHIESIEERVSVGYLAAMLLCGGSRMLVLGINIGALLAGALVLLMALYLGVGAGAVTGMIAGVVLAMQGLPLTLAVSLSLGGFLAGMAHALGRRNITCAAFGMGCFLAMLLSGSAGVGCGAAVLAAAIGIALLPRQAVERGQLFFRRFLNDLPAPGDAYAACALAAWEKTVEAMALAVPAPTSTEGERTPEWWQQKLCEGCPELAQCGCIMSELGCKKAELVWACREASEEIWHDALEELRGFGCQRLYHLRQSMEYLRMEDTALQRSVRRASDQRDMLVTHLTAMAGAARRFAMLSAGESWWDDMSARRIRKELAELAMPMRLSYVRRVQGHIQAAFELQYITGARKQAEDLCTLTENVLDTPMQVMRIDMDRVQLAERPLMQAEVGIAAESITGGQTCGDTLWSGVLQDGRFMATLSDGMGHGDQAALESQQTVELLRLCLEAGYTRAQALTAVNGMMLLAGRGERFSTVDLLTIDLWSGQAALDKLGAAGSWLWQRDTLTHMTGDALPLGILENVESRASYMHLSAGDMLILMTDGVEDAFRSKGDLEEAIRAAVAEDPEVAANQLLQAAFDADEEERRDDQTVLVIRLGKSEVV